MCYSIESGDGIFVKGYGFLSLLKIWLRTLIKI